MVKEKGFYKTFFSLYIILVLQNVVTLSVNLLDNIMLGSYCEVSLSGAASINQIQFVYQQLLTAIGDGLVIFCSRFWGARQTDSMKKVAVIAMHCSLIISLIFFITASLFPASLVGLFTTDSAIIAEGIRYLSVIRFTYFFFAISMTILATLRSVEIVKIAFSLSILTLLINCGINYTLIYGHFGAPELGVTGAAIGTLAARIVECFILIFYLLRKQSQISFHFKDYFHTDHILRKDYFRITLPMLFVQGLWGLNTAMQTVILGHMTSAAIAANSAASTLFLTVKSTAVGAASATSIIIGKTIGTGDLKKVKEYAKTLQILFIFIGIISGFFLYLIRIPVLGFYDLSPETKAMTNSFLIILSIVCMFMSYQMPTNNGIIRGGGNALFVVKMDIISIWGIVIPLSLIMAFLVKASPVVVVCCLNADQVFKCIPAFLESHYGNWIKKLTSNL